MWAELRKTYETTEEDNAYFDYYKYLNRVRKKHPGWKWPGKNNGRWRPPLTHPSDELIPKLKPGTKFTVTNIRYQAVSGGMKYQAVEALIDNSDGRYDQSKVDKTGFIWIWHKDRKYFKEIEKKEEEKKEEETEWIRHDLTDNEIINGWVPSDYRHNWELVLPVVRVVITNDMVLSQNDKFKLTSTDNSFSGTLTMNDAAEENTTKILTFIGTPRNLNYTLEVEPGPDKNGNRSPNYFIYTNKPFNQI